MTVTSTEPKTSKTPPHLDEAQTNFDLIASQYDDSLPLHVMGHYSAKRVSFIKQHVKPGLTLDLGCGTGIMAERLTGEGYQVVALDPYRGMLEQFHQRRPELPVVQASGMALPFPDKTFSLVYCIAVMHHIANPEDVRATLIEMARVTTSGGYILIWDHNPLNPYWPLLMKRVPQDTGEERLIPLHEIHDGLRAGGAQPVITAPLGLVPDFTPPPLLPAAIGIEYLVERAPLLKRLCAHNVVLAIKTGS